MKPLDIIILLVVTVLLVLAWRTAHKKGGCSCGSGSGGKSSCFQPWSNSGANAFTRNQNTLPKGAMGIFSPEIGRSMPSFFIRALVLSKLGPQPLEHMFMKYTPCVGNGGQSRPR